MPVLFIILLFFLLSHLSLTSMEIPLPRQDQKSLKAIKEFESNPKIQWLEGNISVCILKHLITHSESRLLFTAARNTKNFFWVNTAVRQVGASDEISQYVLDRLALHFVTTRISAAACLPTPRACDFLKKANKNQVSDYQDAIKRAVMSSVESKYLKVLIACDTRGLTFQGIPRITPLMVAVGNNNERALHILIAAAKKRNILSSYINMHCPKGTATHSEWFATDSEYSFFCFEGSTVLHIAAAPINKVPISILKKLLQEGADPNTQNKLGPSPLFCALQGEENCSRAKLLMEYDADRKRVLNDPRSKLNAQEIKLLKSYKVKIL